jgi:hypothetical protein
MTKQNLGFIAPFALNILAYVLVYYVFFADKPATPVTEKEVPAAFREDMPKETEDGAFLTKEEVLLTALNTGN